jgi:hypothetical protein
MWESVRQVGDYRSLAGSRATFAYFVLRYENCKALRNAGILIAAMQPKLREFNHL